MGLYYELHGSVPLFMSTIYRYITAPFEYRDGLLVQHSYCYLLSPGGFRTHSKTCMSRLKSWPSRISVIFRCTHPFWTSILPSVRTRQQSRFHGSNVIYLGTSKIDLDNLNVPFYHLWCFFLVHCLFIYYSMTLAFPFVHISVVSISAPWNDFTTLYSSLVNSFLSNK